MGTGVTAAGPGRVAWAGWRDGGWGELVVIAHRNGVRSMYAHLSRVEVRLGEQVGAGFEVGRVGATGHATGPHLHFEVRVRGAAVDPLPALS
jgi:murein DD-endopeptidase MepM/ murein hydrolase activator NlpD